VHVHALKVTELDSFLCYVASISLGLVTAKVKIVVFHALRLFALHDPIICITSTLIILFCIQCTPHKYNLMLPQKRYIYTNTTVYHSIHNK